jgi:hypothetical protein
MLPREAITSLTLLLEKPFVGNLRRNILLKHAVRAILSL